MGGGVVFFNVEKVKSLKLKDLFSDDRDEENNEDNTHQPLEPDSLLRDSFIYEAQNAIEERQNESEHPTNEYLPLTDDEDNENLSAEKYHQKVYEELQNNFFRSKLNNNNLKMFRPRQEALKVPKRTQDAEYAGWSLVEGEPRPEFDVQLFLQRHKGANRHIDRLRDLVGLRVMVENDPIKADEVSNNEEGVMGVVTQFFKQASTRIKPSYSKL